MSNEIGGEYRYLGRREEVEESDLARYIVADENADADGGDRDFLPAEIVPHGQRPGRILSGTSTSTKVTNWNFRCITVPTSRSGTFGCTAIARRSSYNTLFSISSRCTLRPCGWLPPVSMCISAWTGKAGENAREVLEDGAMRYSIKTDYGTCQKPAQFRA